MNAPEEVDMNLPVLLKIILGKPIFTQSWQLTKLPAITTKN
jgi:hypothetical protein